MVLVPIGRCVGYVGPGSPRSARCSRKNPNKGWSRWGLYRPGNDMPGYVDDRAVPGLLRMARAGGVDVKAKRLSGGFIRVRIQPRAHSGPVQEPGHRSIRCDGTNWFIISSAGDTYVP